MKAVTVAVLAAFVATLATVQGLEIDWIITGKPLAEECIAPGEEAVFNWVAKYHNVEEVDAAGYEDCSGFTITAGVTGPYTFTSQAPGTYYFVCGVGGHCAGGKQKIKIKVDPSC
eukprot:GFUD01045241.1.p1 GENE.GFUD01045241.1~~GFUD01045241.1.p1  ORF type:complete len:115 (-),score=38.31 GFUD01045241.1:56-400(-)